MQGKKHKIKKNPEKGSIIIYKNQNFPNLTDFENCMKRKHRY